MKPVSLYMFSSRGIRVLLHVAGWLLFFGLITASSAINRANRIGELFSPPFLLFYAVYIFLFYINENVLLPRLYLRKKYVLYFAIVCSLLLGVAALQPFDRIVKGQHETLENARARPAPPHLRHPPRPQQPGMRPLRQERSGRPGPQRVDIVSIVLFLSVWAVSTLVTLYRQWQQLKQRAAQAEIEKANAELSFLKAQINPHFLFNTLNNIYSLAVEKSDRAPAAIMKLSGIMRYVTDEAKQDFVPLPDEVHCLADYISLQQLRLTTKTTVDFTTSGVFDALQIAPLILMPFVENVFKYGVSAHQPSVITITLYTDAKTLHFFCRNQVVKTQQNMERTGIGIENTKARLQHLYPERHTLVLEEDGETFTVQLTMQL